MSRKMNHINVRLIFHIEKASSKCQGAASTDANDLLIPASLYLLYIITSSYIFRCGSAGQAKKGGCQPGIDYFCTLNLLTSLVALLVVDQQPNIETV